MDKGQAKAACDINVMHRGRSICELINLAAFCGLALLTTVWTAQGQSIHGTTAYQLTATWPDTPEELINALNEGYTFRRTTWSDMLDLTINPQIKAEAAWWSVKPRALQLTVFTQASINRLRAVASQCRSYKGPLSAAVYMPLLQTDNDTTTQLSQRNGALLEEARQRVAAAHRQIEAEVGSCQLDVMLLYEVFDSQQAMLMYPCNYLRNYARLQVRTRLLAMIDVDLLVSHTLSRELEQASAVAYHNDQCRSRLATVLPAFKTINDHSGAGIALGCQVATALTMEQQADKASLAKAVLEQQTVEPFELKTFPLAHQPTQYDRWFNPDTKTPYNVPYNGGYEPWFITCVDNLPYYDVRYRGYGGNKIVAAAAMVYYGASYVVHPDAWVVHMPHPVSSINGAFLYERRFRQQMAGNPASVTAILARLATDTNNRMIDGTYAPAVDERVPRAYRRLPWLQQPPSGLRPVPKDWLHAYIEHEEQRGRGRH